ncbi:CPBP family intramembrane glutamic endopeptidase [Priestia aryabhattai]|uniref:CPBP family intramembrane glutamic endopeptidase n=1 Tax=Priestia aryabhattai TaxID=412384 RepID=UPI001C8DE62C|nr:type II CAAX endopeptidase family protein [Priestia aryabhattai]MBY0213800.1 CPBP family intramembrane metalloprotease [Priestia aryabhattai]
MIFLTLFLLLIIVGYPVWDYFYLNKIKSNQLNKWRMYEETVITQWILVIIFLVYWFLTKHTFNNLFFIKKPLFSLDKDFLLSAGVGAGISIAIIIFMISFSKKAREKISEGLSDESIQFLLPSNFKERLFFLLIAVTAGVCEEIIFRGAMFHYFNHFPFHLSMVAIGIISSLLFGIVHLYQGWKGVLLTSYLGGIMFFLFVGTGSLWVPITLHFIIDSKFVFLPNKKSPSSIIEEN